MELDKDDIECLQNVLDDAKYSSFNVSRLQKLDRLAQKLHTMSKSKPFSEVESDNLSSLERARNIRKRKSRPQVCIEDGREEIWETLATGGMFRMTREEMLARTRANWKKLPDVEIKYWLEKGHRSEI